MRMEILLIRHGESEADILNVHEGRADFLLTERGRQQVRLMAERVQSEFPPQIIFGSTLKRAQETAAILAETVRCPVEYLPELQERDNGKQAGLPYAEGNLKYPMPDLPHLAIEDGETWFQFRMRAESVLSHLFHRCEGHYDRIAIVSHGGMISALLQSFLRMPATNVVWFESGDTAIHLLEKVEPQRVVKVLNDTTHLRDLD